MGVSNSIPVYEMARLTAGSVCVLFALSCALLTTGAHAGPPISAASAAKPVVAAMAQGTVNELKAQVQGKKQVHMLADAEKASTLFLSPPLVCPGRFSECHAKAPVRQALQAAQTSEEVPIGML